MSRTLSYQDALLEGIDQSMEKDASVYVMGLGVCDPKGVFGTTTGLAKKYGEERVIEMPTSENAMTGVAIGSAMMGMRPIMTHQRVDFALLSLDQIINNASKWSYMFGDQVKTPLVIRLIMGRGWGQGPQHSQTLSSLFAHIPGLKVVMPSSPYDAKGLLAQSIEEDSPVIFLEHRWLYPTIGEVPGPLYTIPFGKANVMKEGSDLTIIASSYMAIEAHKAASLLEKEGLSIEVIDLRSIKPFDKGALLRSIEKTGRALIADPDWKTCGFAAEIAAFLAEEAFHTLKAPIKRFTYPDQHTPTSWALANHFYPTVTDLCLEVLEMLEVKGRSRALFEALLKDKMERPIDTPNLSFQGPF